ncbi:hypothetical protein HZC00_03125 [Candidatus Kaiserbacteria bacterium]|nr:hypothetical protein [Candidatus Kaiserbacteria bacterium]
MVGIPYDYPNPAPNPALTRVQQDLKNLHKQVQEMQGRMTFVASSGSNRAIVDGLLVIFHSRLNTLSLEENNIPVAANYSKIHRDKDGRPIIY